MGRLLMGVAAGALLMGAGIYLYQGANEGDAGTQAGASNTVSDAPLTVADAEAFVEGAEAEFREFGEFAARTAWVQNNFITHDTN